MSTGIEWTDETWNPTTGCTKVSAGCKNCYAERVFRRWYKDRKFGDVQLHPDRLDYPLRWRKPRMVFVDSMSDLFHEAVPDEFIYRTFAAMALAPGHAFQVLTKRPERMEALLSHRYLPGAMWDAYILAGGLGPIDVPWPLPNVWLGVSVEDQESANVRVPTLIRVPAALRFVSCEPLLGPVGIEQWAGSEPVPWSLLDWVICGGESGPKARPMHPDWARELRDDCIAAGVPYFFKQWGEWAPSRAAGGMFRFGKKRAGRKLDGREWNEMPEVEQ